MGMPKANVNRLFDLLHATRMDLLDQAWRALGKRLTVVGEDAA
jgi:glycerol-3-phosphate cytidylyltransferase-like family protein